MPNFSQRSETFRIAIRTFGPFEQAIDREWASFREASGCTLALDAVSMDHHAVYESLLANQGLRDGTWDVALINTDWIAEARESASLLDLGPRVENDPPEDFPDGWTPSLLRLQQYGDVVLGLPYHNGPECLIYRTDLFEDADRRRAYEELHGEPLRLPETWDEFVRVARFLHRPEEDLYGTVFAAFADGHNTVYDICLQLWTRGGELFDPQGRMRLDTAEMEEALAFYRAMLNDTRSIHPQSRQFDSVASGGAFARGEVAMMINWFGFAAVCDATDESSVKGRVAIGPIPHADRCASASLNSYWMLSVAAGSPHRDIAYRFVKYCMSRTADRRRTLEGVIGCRKSTWSDEEVNARIPYYHRLEDLHQDARELPRLTDWVELSAVIDRMVLEAINTQRPIESIVAAAQQEAAELQI